VLSLSPARRRHALPLTGCKVVLTGTSVDVKHIQRVSILEQIITRQIKHDYKEHNKISLYSKFQTCMCIERPWSAITSAKLGKYPPTYWSIPSQPVSSPRPPPRRTSWTYCLRLVFAAFQKIRYFSQIII